MAKASSTAIEMLADRLADKIEPVLKDEFQRMEGISFEYSTNNWKALLVAITEKIPGRLKDLGMNKEERMELLGVIDFLDRSVQSRGSDETAKTIFMTLVGLSDLVDTLRNFIELKVYDREGKDITDSIFRG